MINEYFWLICGLWVGLGGVLFGKVKAKEQVAAGLITKDEVNRFLKGYAVSIILPSLLFWVIQTSIGTNVGVDFKLWPNPQKTIALAILLSLWATLFTWVFFYGGAKTLEKFLPILGRFPAFMVKEKSIKIGVTLIIAGGIASLTMSRV